MVMSSRITKIWIAAFMILLLASAGLGVAAHAQEEEPTIEEEYVVELNHVGDGHVVNTIKYSEEDYTVIKETADENEGFLTRRYSAVDFTGEIVDFKTEFDDKNESVVITYDMPGYAYNSEGVWTLYGFPEEPDKNDDRTYTTTETSTINSEFTLFTDQVIKTTSIVKLPANARDVEYDSNEQTLTYETISASEMLGFWRGNRTLLLIVFGILFVLFLGLLIFVITRKSKPAEVPAAVLTGGSIQTIPTQTAAPPSTPQTNSLENITGDIVAGAGPGVTTTCPNCGSEIPEGKHFCTHCGTSLED